MLRVGGGRLVSSHSVVTARQSVFLSSLPRPARSMASQAAPEQKSASNSSARVPRRVSSERGGLSKPRKSNVTLVPRAAAPPSPLLSEEQRAISRELRHIDNVPDLLAHFRENGSEYDFVSKASALSKLMSLNSGMQPWKRSPAQRADVDALINSSIESLQGALGKLNSAAVATASSEPPSFRRGMTAEEAREADAHQLAHLTRAVVSTTASLARVNRLPPPLCNAISAALEPQVARMSEVDVVQAASAFRWANVPAPRLFQQYVHMCAHGVRARHACRLRCV